MKPPMYRDAACCSHCHYYSPKSGRCLKFGEKVEWESVCDAFYMAETVIPKEFTI